MKLKPMRLALLLCLVIPLLTTAGCWDNKDLSERLFIMATGFDRSEDGRIELTVQVAKPSAFGGGGQKGGEEQAFYTNTVRGDTISEAVRNQLTVLNRKSYYYHQQLLVIGEEMAREGIKDILDFYERSPEGQWRGRVMVCRGISAKKVLEAKSDLTQIPAVHLDETLKENSQYLGKVRKVIVFELLKSIGGEGENTVIGAVEGDGTTKDIKVDDMNIQGSAVFKKYKMVSWLTPEETKALLFARGEIGGCVLNIQNPKDKGKLVAIEIGDVTTAKKLEIRDGRFVFKLEIASQGNIWNKQGSGYLVDRETLKEMEKEIAQEIETEVKDVVALAKDKLGLDIFGLGEIVERKQTGYWKGVKENWDEVFSSKNVEVEVSAKSKIKRGGLIIDDKRKAVGDRDTSK